MVIRLIITGFLIGWGAGFVIGASFAWRPRITMAGMVILLAAAVGASMAISPETMASGYRLAYHLPLIVGAAVGSAMGMEAPEVARQSGRGSA